MADRMRLAPLLPDDVPELSDVFDRFNDIAGFIPNNMLIMARRPELVRARLAMADALRNTSLDSSLRDLIFLMASSAAGCRYCTAHGTSGSLRRGAEEEKVRAIWEFETSDLFSESERAALRMARDSALMPVAVTNDHFTELRKHFDEDQIVDIVGQCCHAGWINRWSETMGTPLEDDPFAVMRRIDPEWDPGHHRAPS